LGIFKTFARSQREYSTQIVKIQSDNDTEFKNMNIEEWCDEEGVKHEFSATYTPQQNRVVEHKNKTLITLARAMLDDYGTPKKILGGSNQHGLSCIKSSLHPSTP
jgi:transposase InsO family protein